MGGSQRYLWSLKTKDLPQKKFYDKYILLLLSLHEDVSHQIFTN